MNRELFCEALSLAVEPDYNAVPINDEHIFSPSFVDRMDRLFHRKTTAKNLPAIFASLVCVAAVTIILYRFDVFPIHLTPTKQGDIIEGSSSEQNQSLLMRDILDRNLLQSITELYIEDTEKDNIAGTPGNMNYDNDIVITGSDIDRWFQELNNQTVTPFIPTEIIDEALIQFSRQIIINYTTSEGVRHPLMRMVELEGKKSSFAFSPYFITDESLKDPNLWFVFDSEKLPEDLVALLFTHYKK